MVGKQPSNPPRLCATNHYMRLAESLLLLATSSPEFVFRLKILVVSREGHFRTSVQKSKSVKLV